MNPKDIMLFGIGAPSSMSVRQPNGRRSTEPIFNACERPGEDLFLTFLATAYGDDVHHEIWPLTKGALA